MKRMNRIHGLLFAICENPRLTSAPYNLLGALSAGLLVVRLLPDPALAQSAAFFGMTITNCRCCQCSPTWRAVGPKVIGRS